MSRETRLKEQSHKNDSYALQRWLSLRDACKYSGMSDKTLMRYVHSGEIFGTPKGGKWHIDRLSIDAFFLTDDIVVRETIDRLIGKVQ